MVNSDDNYRREEDRKWRESVETRLVSLTSAQKTTDNELDKLGERLEEMDELLEGDPLKRQDSGLKGDVKELNTGLNELRTIMAPDALGHGGVKNRLENCEMALGLRANKSENRWKFATVIASGTLATMTAIIVALLAIEPIREAIGHFILVRFGSVTPKEPKAAKKGKGKRHGHAAAPVSEAPTETTSDANAAEKEVPK